MIRAMALSVAPASTPPTCRHIRIARASAPARFDSDVASGRPHTPTE